LAGGVRLAGYAHIELQVSGRRDALRQTADGLETLRIRLALRQDTRYLFEKMPEENPRKPIARPGAVGDAGIHHPHGDSAAEAAA
jgi:hypothetical protein